MILKQHCLDKFINNKFKKVNIKQYLKYIDFFKREYIKWNILV